MGFRINIKADFLSEIPSGSLSFLTEIERGHSLPISATGESPILE
jgi:hypothetical protein